MRKPAFAQWNWSGRDVVPSDGVIALFDQDVPDEPLVMSGGRRGPFGAHDPAKFIAAARPWRGLVRSGVKLRDASSSSRRISSARTLGGRLEV
jgi:hypothetical protein